MAQKIVVYSKSACPHERCGPSVRQMPQVFINEQRVGGVAWLQAAPAQLAK